MSYRTIIFLIICLNLFEKSHAISLNYVAKQVGNQIQANCIAEETTVNSGIAWIYPLPEETGKIPNITTKFIPTLTSNDFNCKFSTHSKCNRIWSLKNWQIDENSTRTFDFISDGRWENFPLILTSLKIKEFNERIEIPSIFRLGFSVRSSNTVELLICEGWNPYNHPCYHLNITRREIILRKYLSVPKTISDENILETYKAYSNILSHDEWRSFILSLNANGTLELIDVHLNRTVIKFQDNEALKPIYLLERSIEPTLWKIHHNEFFYTETSQISRLGPTLNLPWKDLCVSLYVSICPNCVMTFFMINGKDKKILKELQEFEPFEWRVIRIKAENVQTSKVTIYMETKLINSSNSQQGEERKGFWAIDDIRVCHESEIKVSYLKYDTDNITDEVSNGISCQIVDHPKWRPKNLEYPEIEEASLIEGTSNSTAITLAWNDEDINKFNYFITFKANDICSSEPYNMRRIKSNGFLMTKQNEITISNLIPYTLYNITFSTTFHEKEKELSISTLESALPTPEELPNKVQIQVADTAAYVSWQKVDCTSLYGHLFYSIELTNQQTKLTQILESQTDNSLEIQNLDPFTLYSLNILTARNSRYFQNDDYPNKVIGLVVNFTTKAGVAPAIGNLESYAVDKDSVSFRYDLPEKPNGVPIYMQVARCNILQYKKCKIFVTNITPCKFWPTKYCLEFNSVIPYQQYSFKISIKNDDTTEFGDDSKIDVYTMEQVPGPPTNISYEIVDCADSLDYCHLNLSWTHPYDQNGSITLFNIILNSTMDVDEAESIHELLKINNQTYLPQYQYQIKYIPYSTHYELYIQSANNKYRSKFTNIHVKTDDIGEHIDQSPKILEIFPTNAIFRLPHVDYRLDSYKLTVVVQDYDKKKKIPENINKNEKIYNNLCFEVGDTWITHESVEITNTTVKNLTIGTDNKFLTPNTQYCVTFIITNFYKNSEHDVIYYKKFETQNSTMEVGESKYISSYGHLYVLLVLLLLVPVGFLIYRYISKRRRKPITSPDDTVDNVYESLPFEECDDNCVTNQTYDHLIHK